MQELGTRDAVGLTGWHLLEDMTTDRLLMQIAEARVDRRAAQRGGREGAGASRPWLGFVVGLSPGALMGERFPIVG